MRSIVMLILASSLVACGVDWNGTYSGTVITSGDCSDGSSVPPSESDSDLTIRDDGDTITWEVACGATVIADVDGEEAAVRQYSCPPQTSSNGITTAITVTGGTLTLDDDLLRMDLSADATLSGALTGTCELKLKGTLAR